MEAYWIWWMAAVVLVIAEMFSGTFYLISVALGLAAAGVSAYMGLGWEGQAAIAAMLCTVSIAGIYRFKQGHSGEHEQSNLAYDIGQTVQVVNWSGERHARVNYRGAEWVAELSPSAATDATRQNWRIKQIVGSSLIIE